MIASARAAHRSAAQTVAPHPGACGGTSSICEPAVISLTAHGTASVR